MFRALIIAGYIALLFATSAAAASPDDSPKSEGSSATAADTDKEKTDSDLIVSGNSSMIYFPTSLLDLLPFRSKEDLLPTDFTVRCTTKGPVNLYITSNGLGKTDFSIDDGKNWSSYLNVPLKGENDQVKVKAQLPGALVPHLGDSADGKILLLNGTKRSEVALKLLVLTQPLTVWCR